MWSVISRVVARGRLIGWTRAGFRIGEKGVTIMTLRSLLPPSPLDRSPSAVVGGQAVGRQVGGAARRRLHRFPERAREVQGAVPARARPARRGYGPVRVQLPRLCAGGWPTMFSESRPAGHAARLRRPARHVADGPDRRLLRVPVPGLDAQKRTFVGQGRNGRFWLQPIADARLTP